MPRLDRGIQYTAIFTVRLLEYRITRWSLSPGSPKARPGGG